MTNTSFKLIQKLFNLYVFIIMTTVTVFICLLDGIWLKKSVKKCMNIIPKNIRCPLKK